MNIHDPQKLERRTLSGSRSFMNIVNWIALTENHSCSSGNFPRTHNTAVSWGNPNDDGGKQKSSACRCITTSIGE